MPIEQEPLEQTLRKVELIKGDVVRNQEMLQSIIERSRIEQPTIMVATEMLRISLARILGDEVIQTGDNVMDILGIQHPIMEEADRIEATSSNEELVQLMTEISTRVVEIIRENPENFITMAIDELAIKTVALELNASQQLPKGVDGIDVARQLVKMAKASIATFRRFTSRNETHTLSEYVGIFTMPFDCDLKDPQNSTQLAAETVRHLHDSFEGNLVSAIQTVQSKMATGS